MLDISNVNSKEQVGGPRFYIYWIIGGSALHVSKVILTLKNRVAGSLETKKERKINRLKYIVTVTGELCEECLFTAVFTERFH